MPKEIKEGVWYDPKSDKILLAEQKTYNCYFNYFTVVDGVSLITASQTFEAFEDQIEYLGEL